MKTKSLLHQLSARALASLLVAAASLSFSTVHGVQAVPSAEEAQLIGQARGVEGAGAKEVAGSQEVAGTTEVSTTTAAQHSAAMTTGSGVPAPISAETISNAFNNAGATVSDKLDTLGALVQENRGGTPVIAGAADEFVQAINDLIPATANDARGTTALKNLLEDALNSNLLSDGTSGSVDQKAYVRNHLIPQLGEQLGTIYKQQEATSNASSTRTATQQTENTTESERSIPLSTGGTEVEQRETQNESSSTETQQTQTSTQTETTVETMPMDATSGAIPTSAGTSTAATPAVTVASITQAVDADNLVSQIKNLYSQMQNAVGQTFDPTTQGTFGAALVQVYNQVVTSISYTSQLLNAALGTPLLNSAQQTYVRNTMIPAFDQTDETTQPIAQAPADNSQAAQTPQDSQQGKNNKNKNTSGNKGGSSAQAANTGKATATTTTPKAGKGHSKGRHHHHKGRHHHHKPKGQTGTAAAPATSGSSNTTAGSSTPKKGRHHRGHHHSTATAQQPAGSAPAAANSNAAPASSAKPHHRRNHHAAAPAAGAPANSNAAATPTTSGTKPHHHHHHGSVNATAGNGAATGSIS